MGLHIAFTALAEVIDAYESRGQSIRTVEASPADTGDAVVAVTLAMPVSLRAGGGDQQVAPTDAKVTDSGGLHVEFTSPIADIPSPAGVSVSMDDASVTITAEGLIMTLELTIDAADTPDDTADAKVDGSSDESLSGPEAVSTDTEGGDAPASDGILSADPDAADDTAQSDMTNGSVKADQPETESESEPDEFAEVRDSSVPAYEDTAYLQALYDGCDNFTEIAERIQMDVSSETVRRYMIEADIHVPNSYNTAGNDTDTSAGSEAADEPTSDTETGAEADDGEAAEPATPESPEASEDAAGSLPEEQLVTDGIGLPADIHLRDVADAVVESDTVYEVQRHLSLDREQTRYLLEQLNLLDLVLCRLADNPEHAASYETVAGRIRQCTP